MFHIVALVLALPAIAQTPRVERFAIHEVGLAAEGQYANPYTDLTTDVVLTPPDGGRPRNAALFWDGGARWKLRLAPDQVGMWKWTVKSRDRGLDGNSGSFECVTSDRRGSIQPMQGFSHHFQRQNGEPFWFLGDTAWALFTDSDAEKHHRDTAMRYVDARAVQGFNVLHSMLLSEAGWGNRGGQPFHDIAAQTLNPAYWQEVDSRLAYANMKGIVCGLALAWGNKGRKEPYSWGRFPDLEARKRYARYIGARYGAYDTYFLVSGEWHGEVRSRKAPEDAVRKEFIEIGDALAGADPQGRMIAIHPMTAEGSVREYTAAKWMAFGDYQQNYLDLHGRLLASRTANRPVVNSEYGYFLRDQSGDGVPDKPNSTSLTAMRHATWDIVMAGGYVGTGFGTTYFGGNRDPGPFDLETAKNDPWEEQIGHIKKAFADLNWWNLQPHDELLSCETARGKEGREFNQPIPPATTYWCLAVPSSAWVVYFRGLEKPIRLNHGENDRQLTIMQFNPRTGEKKATGTVPGKDSIEIRPPDQQDWVYFVLAGK